MDFQNQKLLIKYRMHIKFGIKFFRANKNLQLKKEVTFLNIFDLLNI